MLHYKGDIVSSTFSKPNAQTSDLSFEGERDKEITMPLVHLHSSALVSQWQVKRLSGQPPQGMEYKARLAE